MGAQGEAAAAKIQPQGALIGPDASNVEQLIYQLDILYAIKSDQDYPIGPQCFRVQFELVSRASESLPDHLRGYVTDFVQTMKKNYECKNCSTYRMPAMHLLAFLNAFL